MTVPTSKAKTVTIFGGSGFVGSHIVRLLAKQGHRIRVAVRRPDLAGHLQPLGGVGQVKAVQANLRYRWSVDRAVEGADAVINCVGILYQAGAQRFDAVQAFGARAIAEAARAQNIKTVVHLSAIGADATSDIAYLCSKGEGEEGVLETVPEAVVLRPSIIFGPEDEFFNRFGAMAGKSPALPLFGGGKTRLQPVYVGDVAAAAVKAVAGEAKPGTIYELGGPEVVSFRDCMETMLEIIGRKRLLLPIPFALGKAMGSVLGVLPKPPVTRDQVRMLEKDNVVSEAAEAEGRTLAGLGIEQTAMDVILPTYLVRFREHGQFARTRLT
jgi:NADH dehydrogenase